jgi:hypothetical protein
MWHRSKRRPLKVRPEGVEGPELGDRLLLSLVVVFGSDLSNALIL